MSNYMVCFQSSMFLFYETKNKNKPNMTNLSPDGWTFDVKCDSSPENHLMKKLQDYQLSLRKFQAVMFLHANKCICQLPTKT